MKTLPANLHALLIGGGLVAVLGLALFVWSRGGIKGAAQGAAGALVDLATGTVEGAVGAAGATVGLPLPSDTTADASVARWIIDNHGHLEASKWASAAAYARAWWMDAGTGTPPPAGTPAADKFGTGLAGQAPAQATPPPAAPGLGGLWLDTAGPSFTSESGWAFPTGPWRP